MLFLIGSHEYLESQSDTCLAPPLRCDSVTLSCRPGNRRSNVSPRLPLKEPAAQFFFDLSRGGRGVGRGGGRGQGRKRPSDEGDRPPWDGERRGQGGPGDADGQPRQPRRPRESGHAHVSPLL